MDRRKVCNLKFMFDIFKTKLKLEGLEKAVELGWITQEERLKMEIDRAEKKLKELENKKKK
jgi:hypothetical protein